MGDAGLFADERVELLDGTIVNMAPQNSPHAGTVTRLHRALARAVGDAAHLRTQLPIVLDDWSEPEPDVAVCKLDPYDYTREHPHGADVLLVCEVAESSLAYDRGAKAAAYAGSGIPEYWIVDLDGRTIEIRSDPEPASHRYRRDALVREGETLTAPGGDVIAAADILPRL
jgi:Uma2 family endonuclease